jgi:GNAT superfamily N-acetyltransferase
VSGAPPRVRTATPADAERIARQRVRLFQELAPPDRHGELEAMFAPNLTMLLETMAAGEALAWVEDAVEPAGSLVMHLVRRLPSPTSPGGREGYVIHAWVEPGRRGSGLGAALLAAAEAEARARGITRIRLHSSDRAVSFYRREGYTPRTNDFERLLG